MLFSSWLHSWKRSLECRATRNQTHRRKAAVGRAARLVGRVRPRLEVLEDRLAAAGFTVNTTADTDAVNLGTGQDSSGNVSLRSAIEASNSTSGSNTIQFASGLSGQTITLNGTALPAISQSATINGLGASNLAVSGNNQSAIFTINSGANVSISGLTIEDGNTANNGGGIFDSGTATVSDCTVSGNSASVFGGGIYCGGDASMKVIDSTVENNPDSIGNNSPLGNADFGGGGGICNFGTLTIRNSFVSGNTMDVSLINGGDFGGGGIFSGAVLNVIRCKITNNTVSGPAYGGGGDIFNVGYKMTMSSATLSGNSSSAGSGGLYNWTGSVTINASTISGNSGVGLAANGGTMTVNDSSISTNSGGGIYNSQSKLTVSNSNIEGNTNTGQFAFGGGIYNVYGTAQLIKSTISGNTASVGGGIANGCNRSRPA